MCCLYKVHSSVSSLPNLTLSPTLYVCLTHSVRLSHPLCTSVSASVGLRLIFLDLSSSSCPLSHIFFPSFFSLLPQQPPTQFKVTSSHRLLAKPFSPDLLLLAGCCSALVTQRESEGERDRNTEVESGPHDIREHYFTEN